MNAFVASRIGATAVVVSPAVFLVPIYTSAARDPLSVAAQLAFYCAYLVAVAKLVSLRPVLGSKLWPAWIAICAVLALPPAVTRLVAGSQALPAPANTGEVVVDLICAVLFAVAATAVSAAARRFDPRQAVDLAFPLSGGLFEAIQAGSIRFVNHHLVSRAQRYGVDLVKVSDGGLRFAVPRSPQDLPSYALPVRSALTGTVVAAVDEFDDNALGVRDVRHPFGNHVVIEDPGGSRVFFAHLKRGSLAVMPGQSVRAGDFLGLVGNSGNSTEPHLHVHAEHGDGLPVTFGGRFLVRNSSIRAT